MANPSVPNRVYAAAHFALELDSKKEVGLFRSIEGGGLRADVMSHQTGGTFDRWRQLGKPKYEDIKLQVGMAMSKPFYEWISAFFRGEAKRKNGAIIAADFSYKERARRVFTEAIIKEITFPKLEGSDKGAAYMNVALAVENIEFMKGTGEELPHPKGFDAQKSWSASRFRIELNDFPGATAGCSKIESFTIKQNILEHNVGGRRSTIKTPSNIDFPNLVFYVPEAHAQPLVDRCNARAAKGEIRPSAHMNGHITTYDNDGRNLFTLNFGGADILSVSPDRSDASSEEIKQVKVEMYTESMSFEYAAMDVV
jgi:phage tail-like protein